MHSVAVECYWRFRCICRLGHLSAVIQGSRISIRCTAHIPTLHCLPVSICCQDATHSQGIAVLGVRI